MGDVKRRPGRVIVHRPAPRQRMPNCVDFLTFDATSCAAAFRTTRSRCCRVAFQTSLGGWHRERSGWAHAQRTSGSRDFAVGDRGFMKCGQAASLATQEHEASHGQNTWQESGNASQVNVWSPNLVSMGQIPNEQATQTCAHWPKTQPWTSCIQPSLLKNHKSAHC